MANIDFVCRADHAADTANPAGPTITLYEGLWAYCVSGADSHHAWERVPSASVAEIRMASHRLIVIPEREARPAVPTAAAPSARKRAKQ